MNNAGGFAVVIRKEIERLSRRQIRREVGPLRREVVALKRQVRDLRKQAAAKAAAAKAAVAKAGAPAPAAADESDTRSWITSRGVRALRSRLGLSQQNFARVIGVSPMAIYKWERHQGKLTLRGKSRQQLLAARTLGAREAKARLASA